MNRPSKKPSQSSKKPTPSNNPNSSKQLSNLAAINKLLTKKIQQAKSHYTYQQHDDDQFERRENQLNHKFNLRKQRLVSICKENKEIYCKINTQKSKYSIKEMDKSYRSTSQISKRMSRMKALSRQQSRESSFCSNTSFTSKKSGSACNISISNNARRRKFVATAKPITCETINVQTIDDNKLDDLKSMFFTEDKPKTTAEQTRKPSRNHSQDIKSRRDKENNSNLLLLEAHLNANKILGQHNSVNFVRPLNQKTNSSYNVSEKPVPLSTSKFPSISNSAEKRNVLTDRNRFDIYDIQEELDGHSTKPIDKQPLCPIPTNASRNRNASVGFAQKEALIFRTLPLKKAIPRAPCFLL